MTPDQMRRALELHSLAQKLKRQLDEFVLLKRDSATQGEIISVGDPVIYKTREYHRISVPIPEDARRYVFRLWRKETARKYNDCVRELNKIGATHSFRLVEFSNMTGEPK